MSNRDIRAGPKRDETRELDRFIKFFCHKSIQIVALSRSEHLSLVSTKSEPNVQNWFNLNIPESDQVRLKAKELLDKQLPTMQNPLVIQVSIMKPQHKVIEAWKISRTEECDPTAKIVSGVYAKLVLLLKALLTVSRCTPAYKLCRSHNITLNTEFFFGDVSECLLNDECEKRRFGIVKTPYGSITMSMFYQSFSQIESAISRHSGVAFNSFTLEDPDEQTHAPESGPLSRQIDLKPDPIEYTQQRFPIRAAFASPPQIDEKDLLPEVPMQSLINQLSMSKPLRTISSSPSCELPSTLDKSSEERKELSNSDPNAKPAPLKQAKSSSRLPPQQSYVMVGQREPAFVSAVSDASTATKDVHQFFRIVQHAACLHPTDPDEGTVISHDIPLSDYLSSFTETSQELNKLVGDL